MILKKFSGYHIAKSKKECEAFCQDMQKHQDGFRHLHEETAIIPDDPIEKNCDLAELEQYFRCKPTKGATDQVKVGRIYRHFKGNRVKVIAVAQDTENPGAWSVVYESLDINPGTIWYRPYDMFTSQVDRKKYPEAEQHWRFEQTGGDE